MYEKDILIQEYLSDNVRFADLVNVYLFDGSCVVTPDMLEDADSPATMISGRPRRKFLLQKYRDVAKKVIFGIDFIILGIENQDQVHYGMPVRTMVYDSAGYDRQLRRLKKDHRARRDLPRAEFLSGFSKSDRLKPVITIVIYYGQKDWDGPKALFDMIDWNQFPSQLKKLTNNYKINLLEARNFPDVWKFQSDLKAVFGFLQHANDHNSLQTFVTNNEDYFMNLEEDAYDVICALSGAAELLSVKADYHTEGGINMCQAIKDMIAISKKDGMDLGINTGVNMGIERVNRLNQILIQSHLYEDIEKASSDTRYQKKLFEKYQLH